MRCRHTPRFSKKCVPGIVRMTILGQDPLDFRSIFSDRPAWRIVARQARSHNGQTHPGQREPRPRDDPAGAKPTLMNDISSIICRFNITTCCAGQLLGAQYLHVSAAVVQYHRAPNRHHSGSRAHGLELVIWNVWSRRMVSNAWSQTRGSERFRPARSRAFQTQGFPDPGDGRCNHRGHDCQPPATRPILTRTPRTKATKVT